MSISEGPSCILGQTGKTIGERVRKGLCKKRHKGALNEVSGSDFPQRHRRCACLFLACSCSGGGAARYGRRAGANDHRHRNPPHRPHGRGIAHAHRRLFGPGTAEAGRGRHEPGAPESGPLLHRCALRDRRRLVLRASAQPARPCARPDAGAGQWQAHASIRAGPDRRQRPVRRRAFR